MPYFCVNTTAQPNGDHEVHDANTTRGCLPVPQNRLNLGSHDDCRSAVREATTFYPGANGCAHCAPACHTT